uniref:Vesicle transport protein n=1 Tax=Romanomermis culicivorax TaxID=13658 RepID=A0A915IX23_ROMCU
MDKLRRALSGQEDDGMERGIVEEITQASSWSWETRIKGFVVCFVAGILLSLLGVMSIFFFKYTLFALLFTMGSVAAILSTFFLMGPIKQLQKMFAPTRLTASIATVILIVLTFMAGLVWKNGALCLLFLVLQFMAMAWYALSYIPYARDAVKKCCNTCMV